MNKKIRNIIADLKNKINNFENILNGLDKDREKTTNSIKNELLRLILIEKSLYYHYDKLSEEEIKTIEENIEKHNYQDVVEMLKIK